MPTELKTMECGCVYESTPTRFGHETEMVHRCEQHQEQQDRINQLLKPPSRRRGRRKHK